MNPSTPLRSAGSLSEVGRLSPSTPASRIVSNGSFTTLLTASGTGFSKHGEFGLTRWRGDRIEDPDGYFVFVRDRQTGAHWRLGARSVDDRSESNGARWSPGEFELSATREELAVRMEVWIAPDAPLEIRKLTVQNLSAHSREIEITTFLEPELNRGTLAIPDPAFSRLFLQTSYVEEYELLTVSRRPRSRGEETPWLLHALLGPGSLEYETERARFVGRGGSGTAPAALRRRKPLSGTVGNPLDPCLSLRRTVPLAPSESRSWFALLGTAPDRDGLFALAARHGDIETLEGVRASSREHHTKLLEELSIGSAEAERFHSLAGAILYGDPALCPKTLAPGESLLGETGNHQAKDAPSERCESNGGDSFDGALPEGHLILQHLSGGEGESIPQELVQGLRYWRAMCLPMELLIIGEAERIEPLLADLDGVGIHFAPADRFTASQLDHVDSLARMIVRGSLPTWDGPEDDPTDRSWPSEPREYGVERARAEEPLQFFNGIGGFSHDGTEYVIRMAPDADGVLKLPPMPWVNVLANERFGSLLTERGAGFTWSGNSRERRLSPWSNDPVVDPHGEALYVRDDETGAFHSPLPGPAPSGAAYEMRHGFGYCECSTSSQELELETRVLVPRDRPVKIVTIRITNRGNENRSLSLFSYQRLVLGGVPEETGKNVVTTWDARRQVLTAKNPKDPRYERAVTFAAAVTPGLEQTVHHGADRETFLGRGGTPSAPAAVAHAVALDGRTGAGLDPCFALQVPLALGPRESRECSFLFGEGADLDEVNRIVGALRQPAGIDREREAVDRYWTETLSAVRISTPDLSLDFLVNGWLTYQNLSCRMWGRSALYQSGGAFGYRDQLQDSAALIHRMPELTRAQILLHAAHQFIEGDVLHWWHPPDSRGIRTRFADDLLWLPLVTAQYVQTTGDASVLDEDTRFLSARLLEPGEDEAFMTPEDSGESGTVFEHCLRALDRSLRVGDHGLPLFGSGDWNDSMNRVGVGGRGESVWMAFFLYYVLGEFLPLCRQRGDEGAARRYEEHRERLAAAIEQEAWDGDWYRRGFYDDGAPLGSKESEECRIDALAQAWSVISGAARADRTERAIEMLERELISEEDGLIRLLKPPFEHSPRDPGYIKGYVAGVRENGGQYTHAALWVVRALAELGKNGRAARLLAMLSPIQHARTPTGTAVYKVEPYVIAADVYGTEPHVGRGGWTWYTGSAGWMERVTIESVLGLQKINGDRLRLAPCVPDEWPGFEITYRIAGGSTVYHFVVTNPARKASRVTRATVDGVSAEIENGVLTVPIREDGERHRVEVTLGER